MNISEAMDRLDVLEELLDSYEDDSLYCDVEEEIKEVEEEIKKIKDTYNLWYPWEY